MAMNVDWGELGIVRVQAASPVVVVADISANLDELEQAARQAAADGTTVLVTPELGLTGYSLGDLFAQDLVIDEAWTALRELARRLEHLSSLAMVVGLPVRTVDSRLYNCAAVLSRGEIRGLVPKQHLASRSEFYEDRWFTRASGRELPLRHRDIPFGTDLLFDLGRPGQVLGVELCEDLWSVDPPSGRLALAGATIIANPSASPEVLGKAAYRRDLVRQQSARCLAGYVYAGSGPGESSTDLVFGGHCLIAENGALREESARFATAGSSATSDLDVGHLLHDRAVNTSFSASVPPALRIIDLSLDRSPAFPGPLRRAVDRRPFVPAAADRRSEHCEEIFAIQATGLAKRLMHTSSSKVVLGLSGGLDSTLALLVCVRAFDTLGLDRSGIHTITMPGFGTTDRTYSNALSLMAALGTSAREIAIGPSVSRHFADIGHDPNRHDVVFENAQARERTQILMDVANEVGGFVVGTGDLSESALGWMTFNGDHMSMYHVNIGVPKTLVAHLVSWAADEVFRDTAGAILHDIVDTPITPELLPLRNGELVQRTEDVVGPYELHDFFLFRIVRHGERPRKVLAEAERAFEGFYDLGTITKWLEVFVRRFFSQQFKRSAMPDGPKVGSVALSPRGDWRMPSDASSAAWLDEIARVVAAEGRSAQ